MRAIAAVGSRTSPPPMNADTASDHVGSWPTARSTSVVAGSFRTSASKPGHAAVVQRRGGAHGQVQPPPSIASRSVSSARTAGDVIVASGSLTGTGEELSHGLGRLPPATSQRAGGVTTRVVGVPIGLAVPEENEAAASRVHRRELRTTAWPWRDGSGKLGRWTRLRSPVPSRSSAPCRWSCRPWSRSCRSTKTDDRRRRRSTGARSTVARSSPSSPAWAPSWRPRPPSVSSTRIRRPGRRRRHHRRASRTRRRSARSSSPRSS